jgi:carbon monoxide dehydrogenase subunit G
VQLEQSFTLPVPSAQAWPAFQDVALLVECLPGASLTGPAVDGELPLRFDVKLGPIAAAFAGSGRVSFDDAARSGRFEGQAVDKRTQSRVKGAASFQLQDTAEGCRVQVGVDYTLAGSLAQLGRGAIVKELAGALTSQFAANLAARLQAHARAPAATSAGTAAAQPGATEPPPATDTAAPPAAPPPATQPLSALGLIGLALKAWWRRWLQRLRGRASG